MGGECSHHCAIPAPHEARKVFIYENNHISGKELDDLLVPLFAEPGREGASLTRYLEDVNCTMVAQLVEHRDVTPVVVRLTSAGPSLRVLITEEKVLSLQLHLHMV